mgnify:CR=1 FL=1
MAWLTAPAGANVASSRGCVPSRNDKPPPDQPEDAAAEEAASEGQDYQVSNFVVAYLADHAGVPEIEDLDIPAFLRRNRTTDG